MPIPALLRRRILLCAPGLLAGLACNATPAGQEPRHGQETVSGDGAALLPARGVGPVDRIPIEQIVVQATSFLPKQDALFGAAVCTLDFDGDGHDDVAVGASGESAVYIFMGPEFDSARRYRPVPFQHDDSFGSALAAAPLDGRPGDELVVGAPTRLVGADPSHGAVFLVSHPSENPVLLDFEGLPAGLLGTSVAAGDFDGNGNFDVAAGAPKTPIEGQLSGAVALLSLRPRRVEVLLNPRGPLQHGNYGHDLAVGDADGDGVDDLFVSGIGNPSSEGVRGAGQVFVHLRPLSVDGPVLVAEDPAPTKGDPERFGMSISVGDVNGDGQSDLLVGAPRKNGGGIADAGAGFLFFAPDFSGENALVLLRPGALPHDLFGFRALIADTPAQGRSSVLLASLSREQELGIVAWAADDLAGAPTFYVAPQGASHHFVQGMRRGPRVPGHPATVLLGDPFFDPGNLPDSGRMLVIVLADAPSPEPGASPLEPRETAGFRPAPGRNPADR